MANMKYSQYIAVIVVCILAYFPLFHELKEWPIHIFDESRTALNALSMSQNGNYIVSYVNEQPDMWNTKPPLFFWVQSLAIQIFGFNALGIRIASALFGMFTCLVVFIFSLKYLQNKWIGFLAVLVLVTTSGYIRAHVTRTGDFDSMLVLFTTAQVFLFYSYLQNGKSKYLLLFFAALTLAGLTKGIAALFFTPIFFLYLFIERKFVSTLTNKYTWLGILIFLFFVLGYYVLREQYNPGYIKAAFGNDMGGRFTVPQEGQGGDLFYYFKLKEYIYWIYFLISACFFAFFTKHKKEKKLLFYIVVLSVFYLGLISKAETKLPWYLAQLYPLWAIMVGIFLHFVIQKTIEIITLKQIIFKQLVAASMVLVLFVYPYQLTMKKVLQGPDSQRNNARYDFCYFIQDEVINGNLDLNNYIYLTDRYNPHIDFQIASLNVQGVNIRFEQKNNLYPGDKIVLWQKDVLEYLKLHYSFSEIKKKEDIYLIEIKDYLSLSR
jgi:4-amino-4-deoxy-L-arabinose transferase-like glycosyltransferase